jgi:hypothetical protein
VILRVFNAHLHVNEGLRWLAHWRSPLLRVGARLVSLKRW